MPQSLGALGLLCMSLTGVVSSNTIRVGVVANYEPSTWSKSAACLPDQSNEALTACNAAAYAKIISAANTANIDMLVFPEGYALGSETVKSDYFDFFDISTVVKTNPCLSPVSNKTRSPLLTALSCAVRDGGNRTSVALNLFTIDSSGKRHITEVVFDANGIILAAYHKNHLFETEKIAITPGPFDPTSFMYYDPQTNIPIARFGLVICYEGVYPFLHNDWSQFDALVKDQGSSVLIWSIGGTVGTFIDFGNKIAEKYNVTVLATEQKDPGSPKDSSALIEGSGHDIGGQILNIPTLADLGYTGLPFIKYADISV